VLCLIQEDTGIRYDLVTGVQTCALPIYTRERRAKATALSMRGTKPKRSPDSRNFSQRSSSSKMRTSTSRVNRGRPNKDAATPPIDRKSVVYGKTVEHGGQQILTTSKVHK